MGNDLIEIQYQVVDKGKSLKVAYTGVERMEKSLTKLSKEISSNTVTQERQRKALIAYGRELKRLTGMTGNAAYGAVKKYSNAVIKQTMEQNKSSAAAQRLAKVQDYLTSRQNRLTVSTVQATAATNKLNVAQSQTKNKMNGNNMAIQQLGYQVGDFAIQVQGGTSAFVAFSQQGSQLAGMLPMIAGPLGLSMKAAVGLSAALGIGIPIFSAVARGFFEMGASAEEAQSSLAELTSSLKDYKDAVALSVMSSDDLEKKFGSMAEKMQFLSEFFQSVAVSRAMESLKTDTAVFNAELAESTTQIANLMAQMDGLTPTLDEKRFLSDEELLQMTEAAAGFDAQIESIADNMGMTTMQIRLLDGALKDVSGSKTILEIRDNSLAAIETIKGMSFAFGEIPIELVQVVENLQEVFGTATRAVDAATDMGSAIAELFSSVNRELRTNLEIAILQTDVINGVMGAEDALGKLKATNAKRDFLTKLAGKRLSEDELLNVVAIYDALLLQNTALVDATASAKDLAKAAKEAARAMSSLTKFGENIEKSIVGATAEIKALKEGGDAANASMIASRKFELVLLTEIALATAVGSDAKQAAIDTYEASLKRIAALEGLLAEKDLLAAKSPTGSKGGQTNEQYIAQLIREIKQKKSLIGLSKEEVKVATLRNKIKEKGIKLTDENVQVLLKEQAELIESTRISEDYQAMISDIRTGLTDAFTSVIEGTKSVGSAFKDMIRQMLMSLAQKSFIQPLVGAITGGASASRSTQAIASGGSSLLGGSGTFAAGASALGSGLYAGAGSALGFGSSASVVASAELATGAMGAFGTSLGAIAGPLAAVALAIGFLSSKTKILDSGLKGTVTNMDATIESFEKLQKSRFFGLSKSVSTKGSLLSDEDAAPMIEAIKEIQMSVMDAAGQFGIANEVFDNFTHDFKLSLKGLSEEAKKAAIAEEFTKMGDAFAQMTEHFETMAEAIEAANQRMALQNRLDALLGNNAAILARQREAEIKAVHELNKELLVSIHRLEDAQSAFAQADQAVGEAFKALRLAIDAEKKGITDAFTSLLDGLKIRLDAANEVMKRTQTIVNMLEGALSGRSVTQGLEQKFARREGALNFIRGGDFEDEQMLRDALSVVGEPTEQLFGSFVEYAREFGRTSLVLEQARGIAQFQLTAAEEAVIVLERQIEASEEANESQLAALDERYILAEKEYAALLGIDTSIMSVEAAIANLAVAMQAAIDALAAQRAAAAAAAVVAATPAVQTPTTTPTTTSTTTATATSAAVVAAAAAANRQNDESHHNRQMAELNARSDAIRDARAAAAREDNVGGGSTSGSSSFSQAVSSGWDKVTSFFGFATGGDHTGGLRMVGERGPELEATGPSRIFSNKQTSKMFSNPELVEEIRGLRSEVSGLRSEQRQMQASSSKYVKRNYEINRKWDVDGLPATRT